MYHLKTFGGGGDSVAVFRTQQTVFARGGVGARCNGLKVFGVKHVLHHAAIPHQTTRFEEIDGGSGQRGNGGGRVVAKIGKMMAHTPILGGSAVGLGCLVEELMNCLHDT